MAEGAIRFILSTISPIIQNEYNLLQGVRDRIEFIRNEFEVMNVVLQEAGDMEDTDPLFDAWVKQVRDTAYDAGDVLEQFVFHLEHRHGGGFSGFLSRSSTFMKTIFVRHRIASEIQRIKLQVEEVSQRKQRYTLNDVQASSSSNTNRTKYDIRRDALLLRENEIVGITGPKTELINWLVDEKFHKTRVLSVCGMGGLGKTTLVKKIYDDPQLVKHFQAHAWITVSKSFQTKEILKEIIKKLYSELGENGPVGAEEKDTTDLVNCISNFLQPKRYVIVLDDIWDEDAWKALKYAFPNNNCGSRVIITTRDTSLSSFACNESNGKIHNLEPLPGDESRTLFCQKVFQSDSCPSILEETTKAILKKCAGLPLAIVAIGGLLSTKGQSIDEWNKISRGLGAELRKEGKLSNLDKVLSLSYFDLPWHLKLCFLYLSVFPEDYSINHWRLIRLWIAEGFVLPTNSELTEEEVAGSYLTELTDRSLIQIKRVGLNGRAKEYHIHDIWRELIISRSSKHDLVSIYSAQQNNSTQRVRRLTIHNKTRNWQEFKCRATHLRSLLTFGSVDLEFMSSIMDSLGDGAKLLKVLDMRNQGLQIPRKIGQLLHLKYLSLRGNYKLQEIPKSIGNLQMLETLDLKDTGVRKLPNEILKLNRLRHLLVGDRYKGFKALKGMEKLLCLEKLFTIELKYKSNNDDILRSISKLTRLRKVKIMGLKSGDAKELCSTIEKLTELRSLYISAETSMDLERLSSPPKFLKTLVVSAKMEKLPKWIASLHYVTKLEVSDCELKEDPLLQLQDLPNLTFYLKLNFKAYLGEELCFKAGTFKQLVELYLFELYKLKHMNVMEGAMPRLKELYIGLCPLMEELPSGIETLSSLSLLVFSVMSGSFKSKLKGELEKGNASKFAHIPVVRVDTEVFYGKSETSTSYSIQS